MKTFYLYPPVRPAIKTSLAALGKKVREKPAGAIKGTFIAKRLTDVTLNDQVTQHMRQNAACLHIDQTVGEALEGMRRQPPAGRIIYFYVVDANNRLQGVVPTRRLLLSPLDEPIAQIMVHRVIALPAQATVREACEFFILHRLLAFPVVDQDGHLLGVIDVELYTDEISEIGRLDNDLFQLIGVHVAQARQISPLSAFRSRFPWLLAASPGASWQRSCPGCSRSNFSIQLPWLFSFQ